MGNDYIFFDEALRERFVRFVSARSIACQVRPDTMEGWIVELSDELDDDASNAIEAQYQALMDEQMVLAESTEGWVSHRVVGVPITRSDGSSCVVRLPAETARPLLEHFTPEQVHALGLAIAHSLDNPSDGPLCDKGSAAP